jgi:glycine cleavage system H lipoate-binding protein
MNQEELRYTEEHLWVHVEGVNARFGITDHAQKEVDSLMDAAAYIKSLES